MIPQVQTNASINIKPEGGGGEGWVLLPGGGGGTGGRGGFGGSGGVCVTGGLGPKIHEK